MTMLTIESEIEYLMDLIEWEDEAAERWNAERYGAGIYKFAYLENAKYWRMRISEHAAAIHAYKENH